MRLRPSTFSSRARSYSSRRVGSPLRRAALEREALERELPERELLERELPERELLERELPERELPEREPPERELPERELPEREPRAVGALRRPPGSDSRCWRVRPSSLRRLLTVRAAISLARRDWP